MASEWGLFHGGSHSTRDDIHHVSRTHTHADGPCDCGDFRWCRAPDGTARAPRATGSHCVVAAETSLFMSDMFFCLFSFLCLKCGRGEGRGGGGHTHPPPPPTDPSTFVSTLSPYFSVPPLPSFVKRRAETARIFLAALSGGANWHREENAHNENKSKTTRATKGSRFLPPRPSRRS